jgi:bla regulator protein blaR1
VTYRARFTAVLSFAGVSFAWTTALAQQSVPPQFEVASIRPADPSGRGQFQISPGGTLTMRAVTLNLMIQYAYSIRDFQIAGGTGWIESHRYDIIAKPGNDEQRQETTAQMRLRVHQETKPMAAYALVTTKNGPKVKETPDLNGEDHLQRGRGFLRAKNIDRRFLAVTLSRQLGRIVLDETRLKGHYDFELTWAVDADPAAVPTGQEEPQSTGLEGPTIFTALQEQLGLKLEPKREPVEILVIDQAERASEN